MPMMNTFDEESKHQLSKSVPKNSSKQRKTKHKRQATLFKFVKGDTSLNKVKSLIKANSNWRTDSKPPSFDQVSTKQNIINKVFKDATRYHTLESGKQHNNWFHDSQIFKSVITSKQHSVK